MSASAPLKPGWNIIVIFNVILASPIHDGKAWGLRTGLVQPPSKCKERATEKKTGVLTELKCI
jgi:hypothetical protein